MSRVMCFNYGSVNPNYYTEELFVMYTVKNVLVKFAIFAMFFFSYKCTNGNVLILNIALLPTAGNGPQMVNMKRVMFFK